MGAGRTRAVLGLMVLAVIAAISAALLEQPQFDVISGTEWAERSALRAGVGELSTPLTAAEQASPTIASGLILLAGGLIVSVLAFAGHARKRMEPLRLSSRSGR